VKWNVYVISNMNNVDNENMFENTMKLESSIV